MDQIWTSVKPLLKEKVPGHSYRMWIEPIAFSENENGAMVLSCPNLFSKKRISDNYGQMIEEAVSRAAGRAFKVRLIVSSSQATECKEIKQDRQMKLPDIDSPTNGGRLLRKTTHSISSSSARTVILHTLPLCHWQRATWETRTPFICFRKPALEKATSPRRWGTTFSRHSPLKGSIILRPKIL